MKRIRRISRARESGRTRKERRTFTLSKESITLLHDLRAARRGSQGRSVSSVLDDLLRALDKQRRRSAAELAITRFYDGLSEAAKSEDREWGEFSLAQFLEGPG